MLTNKTIMKYLNVVNSMFAREARCPEGSYNGGGGYESERVDRFYYELPTSIWYQFIYGEDNIFMTYLECLQACVPG